jgi:tRNA-2-methylthio-N6-dimethylallyladenosine synthase
MNRGYTRARYLALIDELRAAVPEIALSTDLIVGFPGESDDDFAATLEMLERVGYDNVFVFRYSPRPGTPAATMPAQVPAAIKAERNSRLLEVAGRVAAERSRRLLGRTVEVLVDGCSKRNDAEVSGRTRCNRVVNFHGEGRVTVGDVVHVRVTEALPHSLRGTLVSMREDSECFSR